MPDLFADAAGGIPAWALGPAARRKPLIAIVEDDAAMAMMYRHQLVLEGFDVEVAPDGGAGLELIRNRRPDLVLLDVRMPVMDGTEVLRRVREDPLASGTRVLFLSNYGDPEIISEGGRLGAVDYLIKARTTPAALVQVVRRHLPPGPAPGG